MKNPLSTTRIVALTAVAAASLAFVGCQQTASVKAQPVNTVQPARPNGAPSYIADRRLITDPALHNTVHINPVNTAWSPEGLLKVEIRLVNLTDQPQSLEYRYEWTDEDAMQVTSPASRWILIKLKPHESAVAAGIAPSPAVRDFIFKMNTRRLTPN